MKVEYIDHMGSDKSVVNAARVSFGAKEPRADGTIDNRLTNKDIRLIEYLVRGCTKEDWNLWADEIRRDVEHSEPNQLLETMRELRHIHPHWTPFAHTCVSLRVTAPLFVARQLAKHQAGLVWNEISRRYVDVTPEFYSPDDWRSQPASVKQGSGLVLPDEVLDSAYDEYYDCMEHCQQVYVDLLEMGVSREQARMVLPQSMYTQWIWTGNIFAFSNVYNQRTDSHAQKETAHVVRLIGRIINELFPHSWKALTLS